MIGETKCNESSGPTLRTWSPNQTKKNEQRVTGRMRLMFPQVEVEDAHDELHRVLFVKRGRTPGEVERESAEKK